MRAMAKMRAEPASMLSMAGIKHGFCSLTFLIAQKPGLVRPNAILFCMSNLIGEMVRTGSDDSSEADAENLKASHQTQ